MTPPRHMALGSLERLAYRRPLPARGAAPAGVELYCCDFRDLPVQPGSAALVLTDPPYTARGMDLWADLADRAHHWLRPGGILIAYCGQMHLPRAIQSLSNSLDYWWIFAALHGNRHQRVRQRNIACTWKPVLVYRKPGGSGLPAMTRDSAGGTGHEKHAHPWQQAVDEAASWIRDLTNEGDTVIDPFLGSGSTALAALGQGRACVGGDVSSDAIQTTRARLAGRT